MQGPEKEEELFRRYCRRLVLVRHSVILLLPLSSHLFLLLLPLFLLLRPFVLLVYGRCCVHVFLYTRLTLLCSSEVTDDTLGDQGVDVNVELPGNTNVPPAVQDAIAEQLANQLYPEFRCACRLSISLPVAAAV